MKSAETSLRFAIEKWLAPTCATPIRIARFSRTGHGQRRYVHVEKYRPEGSVSLFFFRHDDGKWQVFPPANDS
ncbi:hypothetical protein J8I87_42145 [Paraburkholderia sp. LEh10]|uniref:hypothetical protein n=1 Tax=Paraburkholderia sp. LEh10 TaxID=2821353 RepID=UPI001AE460EB|nr:hypothetical protein [Paraburkholderia sp. LEh10]MBP0596100.1 hypothetical protein [Paraburkholderia sp. LEh10]